MTIWKKIFYASIILVALGCEPIKLIYVNNLSAEPEELLVLCDISKYRDISYIDSVFYYDSIIVKPKWNIELNLKLPVEKINNVSYSVVLPGSSTVLLEPKALITITEVIHLKKQGNDTLRLFPCSKRNINTFIEDNRLIKRSTYGGKMIIFYIK